MKKFLLLLVFLVMFCSTSSAQQEMSAFVGEKIVYSIKQIGVKAGEAVLSYEGPAAKNDKDYVLILFKADGLNFLDLEKIYADPKTLLPQIVERDLNIFGKKEKIIEYYEPGRIRIVKTPSDGKTTEQVIEKKGDVDNIYCFIYRARRDAPLSVGQSVAIVLPTTDLKVKLVKEQRLNISGKKYQSIFMQSVPPKFKLWFDTSAQKIPLRIDGAVGVGNTTMMLKSYESKSEYAFKVK